MPEFTHTDWYRHPLYYDIVFDAETTQQADFLEGLLERFGPTRHPRRRWRILEPACGSGRLVGEMARRGHRVTGYDASPEMLAFARERLAAEAARVRRAVSLRRGRMETCRLRGPFDLAHCLVSTFKHLLTERAAAAHLRLAARALAPGGLYVLGIHLTDYVRRRRERETWSEAREGVQVDSVLVTAPADRRTRLEWMHHRMQVRRRGESAVERLEARWRCRTYDAAQLARLFARVPALEPVACYDFAHDIDAPRAFDDSQEDLVVVLRKRPAEERKTENCV